MLATRDDALVRLTTDRVPGTPDWSWCVARYAALHGVALTPDVATLLGAALGTECTPDETDGAGGLAVHGVRSGALETLTTILQTPLLRLGGMPDAQRPLLERRTTLGRPSLLRVSAAPFPELAEGGFGDRLLVALAEPLEENDGTRVRLRHGEGPGAIRSWSAVTDAWHAAGDAEWFVWVPCTISPPAAGWRRALAVAVAQQLVTLARAVPPAVAAHARVTAPAAAMAAEARRAYGRALERMAEAAQWPASGADPAIAAAHDALDTAANAWEEAAAGHIPATSLAATESEIARRLHALLTMIPDAA